MDIDLKLTADEVNGIMNVLGNLPTSSGAYPLLVKIKTQLDAQIAPAEEPKQE